MRSTERVKMLLLRKNAKEGVCERSVGCVGVRKTERPSPFGQDTIMAEKAFLQRTGERFAVPTLEVGLWPNDCLGGWWADGGSTALACAHRILNR